MAVAPPAPPVRRLGPDLARGVMLLLIAMAYAGVYAGTPFGTGVAEGPVRDRVAAVLTTVVLDNRAFPMFAILFGGGLAWSVARLRARGAGDAHVRTLLRRRGGYLLLFGAVHAFLVFPGEILASYGLACLLTGWLLLRPTRTIVRVAGWFGAVSLVTVPLVMTVAAGSAGDASEVVPGYRSVGDWIARAWSVPVAPVFVAVGYPLFVLVVLGYLAARAGLLDDPGAHRALLRRVAAGGIAVSVAGAVPMVLLVLGVVAAGPVAAGLLAALQILTGVAGGAGYAAAFALWGLRAERAPGRGVRVVAAAGRRSLTCYLLNSVLVAVLLHRDLIGLGPQVGAAGALAVAAAVWVLTVLLADRLDRAGRPGPLDAVMHRLVHPTPHRPGG
ncbi:DUF418 domain-containing protein [Pseudonocardia sp. HH130630-07]|uniref:DUF418 domain-containing protein n=1 Tax=Pseudonocardia sp. HH130630-07 TaxID=1690815 RepID=UPI000814C638|nr:DUF418 domain-containing protein [Pseudonocardia sp. HH130630-07]ANY08992.1 hypothetical protein AFB00_25050 [Pseudonocardia sp. HH130630-07]